MPEYKEIQIDVKIKPEITLGDLIRYAVSLSSNQHITTKTEETKTE